MAVRAPDGAKLVILPIPIEREATWSFLSEMDFGVRLKKRVKAKWTVDPCASVRSARVTGLVVVAMDDGLAFGAVTMFFLDDGGAVARLMLPYHRTVAIPIPIVIPVTFADGYAGADWTNANANLIRQGRPRESANGRADNQNLLHRVLLHGTQDKQLIAPAVPGELA
jgi:hypothetical protein